mgnify:CR=1 FL=1
MRGDANSAARREGELTHPAQRGLAVAALVLLGTTLATGAATSPFVLPLGIFLVLIVRYIDNPAAWFAPFAAASAVVIVEAWTGGGFLRALLGGVASG